jgi:UDP-N-acetylmuramate: L-alanyl-gamma-D-glutamyl-meso-diaminopimelate ligase
MKRGNPEVEAVLNRKLFYLSLPEVLKNYFLRGKHNLVVTGTHGKTTTTALLTWIMEKGGLKLGYLIGDIPKNFGHGARLNDSRHFVIEGDELRIAVSRVPGVGLARYKMTFAVETVAPAPQN